jgi:predicted  nucleic acid-binding Zn ribbon protein
VVADSDVATVAVSDLVNDGWEISSAICRLNGGSEISWVIYRLNGGSETGEMETVCPEVGVESLLL